MNVSRDGTNRWNLRLSLHDLPPLPAGPAPGYVAWVMPQSLTPMLRLGTVHEGTTALGPFALQSFLVHVSAEPDTTATTRQGRLVLRGESAATRLRPADNYEFFLGGIGVPREQGEHAHHMTAAPDSLGWTGIPMYPGLDMLPSEMALRPPMAAWRLPEQPDAPVARPREVVTLADGDTLDLTAGVVRRTIAGRSYTMFGFNGQYPGPLLAGAAGRAGRRSVSSNALPLPSTVHWHGLRLDERFDGVPGLFPAGSGARRELHISTASSPTAGSSGITRTSARTSSRTSASTATSSCSPPGPTPRPGPPGRVPDARRPPGRRRRAGAVGRATTPTHAAMGRFGNLLLVNGEPDWTAGGAAGEVVRLFLTNVSNTRTFNLSFGAGARLKVVGSDLGDFARESWAESVVIGPAERYVVEVRFEAPGPVALVNAVQGLDHMNGRFFPVVDTLGVVTVEAGSAEPDLAVELRRASGPTGSWRTRPRRWSGRTRASRRSGCSSSVPSGWACRS